MSTIYNPFQKPYKYQGKKMIPWLEDRDFAALFADPGLGKSVTTLKAFDTNFWDGRTKGALIVAPIRVCNITWPSQASEWDFSQWMRVANMRTPEGIKMWHEKSADLYLVNPEMLASRVVRVKCKVCRQIPKLTKKCKHCDDEGLVARKYKGFCERYLKGQRQKDLPIDMQVIDELSLAKNRNAKSFGALRAYREAFNIFWGLTGSPTPNSYLDLWNQMRMLDDGESLGRNFFQFRKRFFHETDYMGYKHEINDGGKEAIHKKLSNIALVMKSEDYLNVPTPDYLDEEIKLGVQAMKAYHTLKQELLLQIESGEIEALNAAALTQKLLQVTGGTVYGSGHNDEEDAKKTPLYIHDKKLKALATIRKRHPKEPLLILTQFKHERARILKAFPEAREFDERDMDKWQRGKIPMWICDPRSMSHGIDGMQKGGRIAVWFTLTYSYESYLQTNARLVRTGQKLRSLIYRIIAQDTVDEAVAEALRFKKEGQNGLFAALKNLQQLEKSMKRAA